MLHSVLYAGFVIGQYDLVPLIETHASDTIIGMTLWVEQSTDPFDENRF